jgi:hypothetical protein
MLHETQFIYLIYFIKQFILRVTSRCGFSHSKNLKNAKLGNLYKSINLELEQPPQFKSTIQSTQPSTSRRHNHIICI